MIVTSSIDLSLVTILAFIGRLLSDFYCWANTSPHLNYCDIFDDILFTIMMCEKLNTTVWLDVRIAGQPQIAQRYVNMQAIS